MIKIYSIDADFVAKSFYTISVKTLDSGLYQAVLINNNNGGATLFSKFEICNHIPSEEIEREMNKIFLMITARQPTEKMDVHYWANFIRTCVETAIEVREIRAKAIYVNVFSGALNE